MGTRRLLSYKDAVLLLGGDSQVLAALDRALGGALSLLTGGVSDAVLNVFDAQDKILRLGRDLTAGLRDSLPSDDRAGRNLRLEAAHAIVVVTAYFTALERVQLPFEWRDVQLTRVEQIRLTGGDSTNLAAEGFARAVAATAPPRLAPHLPYEHALLEISRWYDDLSDRLAHFIRGLAVWDRLDGGAQDQTVSALRAVGSTTAINNYQRLYARLANDVPEFAFWASQIEHQATRVALAGVESLLAKFVAAARPVDLAAELATAYRAALPRPILTDSDVASGLCLPTLAEGYLDPHFRVRSAAQGGQTGPADEGWWSEARVRHDLFEYLAGALTTPEPASAPLVVLGQPGAGKSVMTKVLATRLPGSGFLPILVVLRDVPAEADVQAQIEYAIRKATHETATWLDVVRSAGGLMPFVIFDGFDELLQATGVSHSDYLMRIAEFQQREADLGRPMLALVTTRTAVADRARYPEKAIVLRLEPFGPQQIRSWIDMWNRTNDSYFAARGIQRLSAEIVERHDTLASQPLLLLMLALYDASGNPLQSGDTPLEEAELYEDLLASFAAREVNRGAPALPDDDRLAERVEEELQRLSLIAFATLNRHRQWVTTAELDNDLTAIYGPPTPTAATIRAPLKKAEIAVGRFFFVQKAQAKRDERPLATYEFLHATFGEYLAARLSVRVLAGLLDQRPALVGGPAAVNDDLLYVLLSYIPLSSRQMLRFVDARVQLIPSADRDRLRTLLIQVLTAHTVRTDHKYADYSPAQRSTSSRHGVYSANLVLLLLTITGGLEASDLFPDSDDPAETWNYCTLLWRSAFDEQEWTDFALSLSVHHDWRDERRDLTIGLATTPPEPPEPVDLYWHYRYPPTHPARGQGGWRRADWDQIRYKIDVSGGTNDSVVRHALDPVFNWLGPTLTTFIGIDDEPASSLAHDLLELWFASRLSGSEDDLAALYRRCASAPLADGATAERVSLLLLGLLSVDAARLPASLVVDHLSARGESDNAEMHELRISVCLAVLAGDPQDDARLRLTEIAAEEFNLLAEADMERAFAAWVKVHDCDLADQILGAEPSALLLRCHSTEGLDTLSLGLRRQVLRIAEARYQHLLA